MSEFDNKTAEEEEYLEMPPEIELNKRIIFSCLQEIKENADSMTSGNFMHNKAAIKLKVNYVLKALERLGIEDV